MSDFQKRSNEKYCSSCGAIINREAVICPKCGVPQGNINKDSTFRKAFGIVIAIVLGIFIFRACGWLF